MLPRERECDWELETLLLDCTAADTAATIGQYQLVSIGHAPKAHFHRSPEKTHLNRQDAARCPVVVEVAKIWTLPGVSLGMTENRERHKLLPRLHQHNERKTAHFIFYSLFVSVGALGKLFNVAIILFSSSSIHHRRRR